MSRYNTATMAKPAQKQSAIKSGTTAKINHNGGIGYERGDAKSELFLSAATSFAQNKFYESESELLNRQRKLVAQVAVQDPQWIYHFVHWLRTEGNLRTGSLVIAAEAVKARLNTGARGWNRQIVNAALQRPDEPGEFLAYWVSRYGRNLPSPVKRGVADAVKRLYTERNFLKYDSAARAFRFGDVIELTHPSFDRIYQNQLARYAISVGKGRTDVEVHDSLDIIQANRSLRKLSPDFIKALAREGKLADKLSAAGMTWEDIPSLVNGPWTAELWEAIIPSMGVMALMRNLNNFDAAGISKTARNLVVDKLSDREAVRRSRILPIRALTAYMNVNNSRWHGALEDAVDLTLENVPALKGRTLILVDCSGSMYGYSGMDYAKTASLFGAALAVKAENATLVHYGSNSVEKRVPKGSSVLQMANMTECLGGTDTTGALQRHYNGHDRVILLTDEQHYGGWYARKQPGEVIPQNIPLITFNLAGYQTGSIEDGPNRLTFSSLSDSSWKLVDMFGNGMACWPWEAK